MSENLYEDLSPLDSDWVMYKNRPEWNDVKPVPQDEGDAPVVRIAYNEKFMDVFDYFRAVLLSEEASERSLQLTKDCTILNPANYTVWHFRRIILQALKKELQPELKYIGEVIEDNPKNYQVWHHRQVIVQRLNDPSKEKAFTDNILAMDSKNYHAWQHRQWFLREFNLFDGELEFTEILLTEDVRNNSAWNQRYFVLSQTGQLNDSEKLESEVNYTLKKIKEVPNNESSWNYLRGILQSKPLTSFNQIWKECEEMYENASSRSPHLLAFMVDCLQELLQFQRAIALCQDLAQNHDKIRKEYWNFVARKIALVEA